MAKLKISKRSRSIAVGLVCGLLCAICVGVYIAQVDAKAASAQEAMLAQYGGEQIDVCVAKRDIVAGETIKDGDIETRTWIATLLPADAVLQKKDAVGKQVGSTILTGEVISAARFGFESAAIEVPDGLVAVSVPSREVQAVGGALAVGMATDVYAVGASSTTRIAKSAQVLATSLSTDAATSSTNAWVTLAVDPGIVQELVSAAENLQIYFVLPSASAIDAEVAVTEEEIVNTDALDEVEVERTAASETGDASAGSNAAPQPSSSSSAGSNADAAPNASNGARASGANNAVSNASQPDGA